MAQYLSGSFNNPDDANRAVDDLISLGYQRDDISVIMSSQTRDQYFAGGAAGDSGGSIARGAAGGGMIGGTIGAIIGAVALTGAVGVTVATGGLAAPIIAGPLAAALAGGGAGAAAGSLIGGLVGAGVPNDQRARLEQDVQQGNIVVAVQADDSDIDQVRRILRDDTRGWASGSGGTTAGKASAVDTARNPADRFAADETSGARDRRGESLRDAAEPAGYGDRLTPADTDRPYNPDASSTMTTGSAVSGRPGGTHNP